MNRLNYLVGVGAAFGAGVITGWIALEGKLRKEYQASLESVERAHYVQNIYEGTPVNEPLMSPSVPPAYDVPQEIKDAELHSITFTTDGLGTIESVTPVEETKAIEQAMVYNNGEGSVDNDLEYIDEDEFHDQDDGRWKGQIIMMFTDGDPIFYSDGVPCADWADRVGTDIALQMFNRQPPGSPGILHVRNHVRDEDYEVIRETA